MAVASLALGIGANSAIFQLVDAVRLRTLPVAQSAGTGYARFRAEVRPLRLVLDAQRALHLGGCGSSCRRGGAIHRPDRLERRRKFNLAPGGEARYAEGPYVSGDFFRVLGVQAIVGRTFTPDDDRLGAARPARS